MDDDDRIRDEDDPAAAAFTRLEQEIALMRRAVEQFSTEKANEERPDYSITLGEMSRQLALIEGKPAMEMTPEDMAARIGAAATEARCEDRKALAGARQQHDQAAYALQALLGTTTSIHGQRHRLQWAAGGGLLAGALLWAIMPGVILRALPASWHMPEAMAAHIMGEPSLWNAGSRMMQAGNPGGWQAIVDAADIRRDNLKVITACERAAAKKMRPTQCTIRVGFRDANSQ